jgi:3D (Asp-Asp-Asp) domain-containing protein
LTAYCSCAKCCGKWTYNRPDGIIYGAIGEELREGYSIAVDPNVIPYRTEVVIDGEIYKAQDCGGAIKGNRIDVYFEDHNDALDFGVQYKEIFVNL